jgi:hypothetical protein
MACEYSFISTKNMKRYVELKNDLITKKSLVSYFKKLLEKDIVIKG